jgi:chromate reductase
MTNPNFSVAPISDMHVIGIPGSLRAGSYNRMLLRNAHRLAPKGMELSIYEIGSLPLYNADLDGERLPQVVADFKQALLGSAAILIATPEYNYGVPGVLKNAIDWASRPAGKSPLNGKPIAMMGATTGRWGTLRAQLQLRQIFLYTRSHVVMEPEVMVPQANMKFDETGTLIDEETSKYIQMLLEGLADLVILHRQAATQQSGS